MVLYAVGAEEAVAHASDHLESAGRTSLALAIGLIVCAYAFLAYRSDHFITWERLVGGAVAIAAALGLQTANDGTILWIVAFIIGLSHLLEQPRVRAAAPTESR